MMSLETLGRSCYLKKIPPMDIIVDNYGLCDHFHGGDIFI